MASCWNGRQSGLKIQWDLSRAGSSPAEATKKNMKKKILITGGCGFIGTNLTKYLLSKKKYEIISVDNLNTGKKENIKKIVDLDQRKNYKFIEHDIRYKINIKADYIFNLACPASPPKYQADPFLTMDTCYLGTKNILELAKKNKSIVFHASTSEIYGNPLVHPQAETYFGNTNAFGPRSCYDEGKRIAETLIYEYSNKYDLNCRIARIFNTYGPFMDKYDGRVISNFINQAIINEPITVYGKGIQTRSFCYIDDLIKGITGLTFNRRKLPFPINIGNNKEYSVKKIAELIIKKTKSDSKLIYLDLPIDDPIKRKPDIKLAKKYIDWTPNIFLNEGLDKTIEYFANL